MLHMIQKDNLNIVDNKYLYLNNTDIEAYHNCDYVQLIAYDRASALITQENIIVISFIKSKTIPELNRQCIKIGDFILESLIYKKSEFGLLEILHNKV